MSSAAQAEWYQGYKPGVVLDGRVVEYEHKPDNRIVTDRNNRRLVTLTSF